MTDERTQELRPDNPNRPGGAGDRFLVVLDGIGDRTGSITTSPRDRATAMTDFDTLLGVFAPDVAAGRMRISVLSEDVWIARGSEPGPQISNPGSVAGR